MARTTLKRVDTYPHFVDRDSKMLADASEAPSELISDAIISARLPARDWLFRLHLHPSDRVDDLHVEVFDNTPDLEGAAVLVPRGIATLSPEQRTTLARDLLLAPLTWLTTRRGWDPTVIDTAAAHARRHGGVHERSTPWKSSPDRRHRARAVRHIDADGVVTAHVEIADRDGQRITTSARSRIFRGTRVRSMDLRWLDARTVRLHPHDPIGLPALEHRIDAPPRPPLADASRSLLPVHERSIRVPAIVVVDDIGPRDRPEIDHLPLV